MLLFKSLLLISLLAPATSEAFELVNDASFGSSLAQDAIVGGEPVSSDSRVHKMTVLLRMRMLQADGTSGSATCTGTLIKRDLVLTAAHCVTSDEGKYTISQINVTLGSGRVIGTEGWKFNPAYRRITDVTRTGFMIRPINDVALLKLREPVGEGSLLARLPAGPLADGSSEEMVVAGFGQRIPGNNNTSGILYFAWTEGQMKSVMGGQDFQLEMTGVQPCRGDSGGPLLRASENAPLVVVGVTSHVKGNCIGEARAISVAHQLPWLRRAALELKSSL